MSVVVLCALRWFGGMARMAGRLFTAMATRSSLGMCHNQTDRRPHGRREQRLGTGVRPIARSENGGAILGALNWSAHEHIMEASAHFLFHADMAFAGPLMTAA